MIAIQLSDCTYKNVPSKRYLSLIDECWYETIKEEAFLFEDSELDNVLRLLDKHFLYFATIHYSDGTSKEWTAMREKPKRMFTLDDLEFEVE